MNDLVQYCLLSTESACIGGSDTNKAKSLSCRCLQFIPILPSLPHPWKTSSPSKQNKTRAWKQCEQSIAANSLCCVLLYKNFPRTLSISPCSILSYIGYGLRLCGKEDMILTLTKYIFQAGDRIRQRYPYTAELGLYRNWGQRSIYESTWKEENKFV